MAEINHEIEVQVIEDLPGFRDVLLGLLHSRKVLLALAGTIQTVALHYLNLPIEVWAAIDALLVAVIGAIAYEDGAEKSATRSPR